MVTVLLLAVLATLAFGFALPVLILFFEVAWAWYENLFDRLETAATRFYAKRGWY